MNTKKSIPGGLGGTILAVVATAIVALVLGFFAWDWVTENKPPNDKADLLVKHLKLYIDVLHLIVVGFFVALVTVIIQFMAPESRDRFERYKESRQAYSRAKTAVMYLPDRVANEDSKLTAFELVEKAHRELHLAETFADMIIKRGYLDWFGDHKECWISYNFWQIVAVAEVLRAPKVHFEDKDEVRECLGATREVVDEFFGKKAVLCKGEKLDEARECQLRLKIKDTARTTHLSTPETR